MKKLLSFIVVSFLFSLSSCSSSFDIVRRYKVLADDKLYIGCYPFVETSDGLTKLDVYMYLDFYDSEEIRESDSINFDECINLSNENLVILSEDLKNEENEILKFYDVVNLKAYFDSYETIGKYLKTGNHLAVFFSYGELNDGDGLVTKSVLINEPGIYYFSTVSQQGLTPSYSFSRIIEEKVGWFNSLNSEAS